MACSDILKQGIFDRETIKSTEEFFESIFRWFDYNKLQTQTETQQALVSAGIKIPTEIGLIPLNFDGTWGKSRSHYYSEALKQLLYEERNYRKEFYRDNITANSEIVRAWKDCEQFDSLPLFGQALYEKNSENTNVEEILVKIKLNYIDQDRPEEVIIDHETIEKEVEHGLPGYKVVPFPKTKLSPETLFNFKIMRSRELRNRGGHFIVRTNNDRYTCSIELAALPDTYEEFAREFENPSLKKILKSPQGRYEAQLPLRNLKQKKLLVNVYADFYANGIQSGSTYVFASLDGEVQNRRAVVKSPGIIREWINFGTVAWMPGLERQFKANYHTWGFDREPNDMYVQLYCEY